MKELDEVMKTLAEGLRSLSVGIAAIAAKVEEMAQDRPKAAAAKGKKGPARKKPPARSAAKAAAKPGTKKKPSPKKKTAKKPAATATAKVLAVVAEAPQSADMDLLRKKTGLSDKQIANALYKLKKQKKVKSQKRGLYTVA
jgi:hypothetical protein